MCAGVLDFFLPDHCRCDGRGGHVLSGDRILGLAHLDHAKKVRPAAFPADVLNHFLAGEPAVYKEIV